jgi:hypothetical protein
VTVKFSDSKISHVLLWKNTEAVNYVKNILREIQSNIGQTNVEELLREAQEMLREIKRRNFNQKSTEADEESRKAVEGETVCLIVVRI